MGTILRQGIFVFTSVLIELNFRAKEHPMRFPSLLWVRAYFF
jgi:hypothetical protein